MARKRLSKSTKTLLGLGLLGGAGLLLLNRSGGATTSTTTGTKPINVPPLAAIICNPVAKFEFQNGQVVVVVSNTGQQAGTVYGVLNYTRPDSTLAGGCTFLGIGNAGYNIGGGATFSFTCTWDTTLLNQVGIWQVTFALFKDAALTQVWPGASGTCSALITVSLSAAGFTIVSMTAS